MSIIVLGGAFSPPHNGHLAALMTAKTHLESNGIAVLGSFLAPAPDGYVIAKYKGTSNAISSKHRLAMCNLLSPTLDSTAKTYGSAKECALKQLPNYPEGTKVYVIVGADRSKTSDQIQHLVIDRGSEGDHKEHHLTAPEISLNYSATLVRNSLCLGCTGTHTPACETARPDAVNRLVTDGVINELVGNYLLHNSDAVPLRSDFTL